MGGEEGAGGEKGRVAMMVGVFGLAYAGLGMLFTEMGG